MKSIVNIKILTLITLGIVFAFLTIISLKFNLEYNDDDSDYKENMNISNISGKIHIINNSGWIDFRDDGNCSGSGTYSDPYVIKNLIIDGENLGNCIWIENSDVYFRIENCTIYNSGVGAFLNYHAGIKVSNVNNSHLIDNNCSFNGRGIYLEDSYNCSISGNTANNNIEEGIFLYYSSMNAISENIANYNGKCGITLGHSNKNKVSGNTVSNRDYGIYLFYSINNTISGNMANNCEYGIYIYESNNNTVSENNANDIVNCGIIINNSENNAVSENTINNCEYGIYLYYSINNTLSKNTASYNTKNGIYLYNSVNNKVSGNLINNNHYGLSLLQSHNNTISQNTIKNHQYGLFLIYSNFNLILGNKLTNNDVCHEEFECEGNIFKDNDCSTGNERTQIIIFIAAVCGGAFLSVGVLLSILRFKNRK